MPHPANPQSLNRYAYCLNNPLRYIDPTGHQDEGEGSGVEGWAYMLVPNPYDPNGPEIPLWYSTNNSAVIPGSVQPWYGGSLAWGQGGIPEYVPSGITGNIPTGGSMADVVAGARNPTPSPTPNPTPTPTPSSEIGKWGRVAAALTLGTAATTTGVVEIVIGLGELRTGNPLGLYEIGHGINMAAVGSWAFIAGFISLFTE